MLLRIGESAIIQTGEPDYFHSPVFLLSGSEPMADIQKQNRFSEGCKYGTDKSDFAAD